MNYLHTVSHSKPNRHHLITYHTPNSALNGTSPNHFQTTSQTILTPPLTRPSSNAYLNHLKLTQNHSNHSNSSNRNSLNCDIRPKTTQTHICTSRLLIPSWPNPKTHRKTLKIRNGLNCDIVKSQKWNTKGSLWQNEHTDDRKVLFWVLWTNPFGSPQKGWK